MEIKKLIEGSEVHLDTLNSKSRKTQPPGRYSEVSLTKALADLGIGRPSTYSTIVSIIQDRGYVVRKGTQLYPTALGFSIANMLTAKLPEFVDYGYTAKMETVLEEIVEKKESRLNFLTKFWKGPKGFFAKITKLLDGGLTFDEIDKYSTIDLYNGYVAKFNRFGTFIEDTNGTPNEKGYRPSAKIGDTDDLWEYKDPELCSELISKSSNIVGPREVGILKSGVYEGWTVYAKEGRYGDFLQAMHPDQVKAESENKKPARNTPAPITQSLPKDTKINEITLKEIEPLFTEIKLPRWSKDKKWLVGIGKKGAYCGFKKTAKSRPVFKSLPEEFDPRTVDFEKIKEIWETL